MSDNDLIITSKGHVAIVEINRPPFNFFDLTLIASIASEFEKFEADPNCRAIVLGARGKAFCAGANFGGDSSSGDAQFSGDQFADTAGSIYREAARLFDISTPIVGAIQGAAVGGGLGLALVPDFRVVAPDTRFCANFVKLGIHPGFGLSVTLPRLIGSQAAKMLLLTGRNVRGEEAQSLGLADILTERDRLLETAIDLANEITENAPLAVASVKRTLKSGLAAQVAEITEHELAEQISLRKTDDASEGLLAVSERRPGKFTGR